MKPKDKKKKKSRVFVAFCLSFYKAVSVIH